MPVRIEAMTTTVMTPITIPSTVSELRNLLARRLVMAMATFSNVRPLEMVCIVVFQDELPNREGVKNAKQNLKGQRSPGCDRLLGFQHPARILGLLARSLCP